MEVSIDVTRAGDSVVPVSVPVGVALDVTGVDAGVDAGVGVAFVGVEAGVGSVVGVSDASVGAGGVRLWRRRRRSCRLRGRGVGWQRRGRGNGDGLLRRGLTYGCRLRGGVLPRRGEPAAGPWQTGRAASTISAIRGVDLVVQCKQRR